MMLPAQILAQCAARPEAVAILEADGGGDHADGVPCLPVDEHRTKATRPLRYGELGARVGCLAAALRPQPASGGGRGSVVAVLADEAPASVLCELAASLSGAAFVPLDPGATHSSALCDCCWRPNGILVAPCPCIAGSPVDRLRYQLRDCGAYVLLHTRGQAALVASLLPLPDDGDGHGRCYALAVDAPPAAGTPDDRASAVRGWSAAVQPTDVSHIIYTSGSTGPPKGVVCEHGALASYASAKRQAHSIDSTSRVLLAAAATWDPSVGDAFSTLACGGCLVVAPRARLMAVSAAVVPLNRRKRPALN
jgi:non-ribosomal peptide synthetase component F